MKSYYTITIEATDIPEEEMREYVDRMLRANRADEYYDVRFRLQVHVEKPVVVSERLYQRAERALFLIESIKNF